MMKNRIILVTLLLTWIFIGCKSKVELENINLRKIGLQDVVTNCQQASFKGSNLYLKKCEFSVTINDKVQNGSGSIFVLTDSFIVVSVQAMLGIEVARLRISPLEVTILDRFHKQVIKSSYSKFVDTYARLSFENLQALLCNQLYNIEGVPTNSFSNNSFKVSYLPDGYGITSVEDKRFLWVQSDEIPGFLQQYLVHPTDFSLLKSIISKNNLSSSLAISYSSFVELNGFKFPLLIQGSGVSRVDTFTFQIKIGSAQVNSPNTLNFSIPEDYELVVK